ncbi:MAG TPA: heme exporter protein CcmD [Methylomirabilota bacterium]|jgi:heme exporter protein CcmD|nr:heme exporter protein CcmD [Methylomirabilota bacterium]
MEGVLAYLDMGGHGGFIWAAYAAAALVLVGVWVLSWRGLKRSEEELKRLETRLPGARPTGTARGRA